MFTSFGYFDDKKDDLKVLENVFVSLKPGGFLLIDVMGKERIAKILQPTISDVLDDGTTVVQRPEIYDDWTRVRNDWIIIKGSQAKTFKFHHKIYSGQELKDRMEIVGFEAIKLYGSLDGSPYDSNAQRLIITGIKPSME
jgi:SAM-dependent methyltransferase